jgi:ferredoxin
VSTGQHRISLDADACCGHGRCYSLAPDLFDADDYGHSVLLHQLVDDSRLAGAQQAVLACPEQAISVTTS